MRDGTQKTSNNLTLLTGRMSTYKLLSGYTNVSPFGRDELFFVVHSMMRLLEKGVIFAKNLVSDV